MTSGDAKSNDPKAEAAGVGSGAVVAVATEGDGTLLSPGLVAGGVACPQLVATISAAARTRDLRPVTVAMVGPGTRRRAAQRCAIGNLRAIGGVWRRKEVVG
jgi:hypothetical protein